MAIPAALGWTADAVTTCASCCADLRVPLTDGEPSGEAWGWLPPGEPHPVTALADLGRTAWAGCLPRSSDSGAVGT